MLTKVPAVKGDKDRSDSTKVTLTRWLSRSTPRRIEKHVGYHKRLNEGSAQENNWLEEKTLKETENHNKEGYCANVRQRPT